ncbi:hypothetical protein TNCV_4739721 [Trichonephila clavipes]|nr:hypothetical protein TNCV_4739721 [Trichonephila clavipes]
MFALLDKLLPLSTSVTLYIPWTANLSLYPHRPLTNQRAASQLSLMSKFIPIFHPEENSKPRLPDLLATTNHLHTNPLTVKFHLTPSPSSKTFLIWD